MQSERFPKTVRLLSRTDFRRVYERRSSVSNPFIRLLGRLNDREYPRIGLSVSRQVGNAVVRNRWKRLLREAFRLSQSRLPKGLDFVVIPQASAEPELEQLKQTLVDLSWRLHKRLDRERSTENRLKRQEQEAKRQRRNEKESED
ncbi:MAG TPA: ribonuclease P protein component [Pirellulales bacterium]|jgi:ribonuclease P protein component